MAKPNPPRVDLEALDDFLKLFDTDTARLAMIIDLAFLSRLAGKDEFPDTIRSLELLRTIVRRCQEEPELVADWNVWASQNEPTIKVPLRLLRPVADGWEKYLQHKGVKFNAAMKVSKGQGSRLRDQLNTARADFAAAMKIELLLAHFADEGEELSIEAACGRLALLATSNGSWEHKGQKGSDSLERRLKLAYDNRIDDVRAVMKILRWPIKPPASRI